MDAKDIELVMSQTGVSRKMAARSLRENNNDIVDAIMVGAQLLKEKAVGCDGSSDGGGETSE